MSKLRSPTMTVRCPSSPLCSSAYCERAGADEQPRTAGERGEQLRNAVIDAVLKNPDIGKPLAIERDRALGQSFAAEHGAEALEQGRHDAPQQLLLRRARLIEGHK